MITVSLIGWLDLPAFSLVEWFQGQPLIARVPAGVIREYMKAYAKEMGLMERLRPHTRVAQVIVSIFHCFLKCLQFECYVLSPLISQTILS